MKITTIRKKSIDVICNGVKLTFDVPNVTQVKVNESGNLAVLYSQTKGLMVIDVKTECLIPIENPYDCKFYTFQPNPVLPPLCISVVMAHVDTEELFWQHGIDMQNRCLTGIKFGWR